MNKAIIAIFFISLLIFGCSQKTETTQTGTDVSTNGNDLDLSEDLQELESLDSDLEQSGLENIESDLQFDNELEDV